MLHLVASGCPGSRTRIFRCQPTHTSGPRDSYSWCLPQLGLLGLLTVLSPPCGLSSMVASEAPATVDAGPGLQRCVSQEGEPDGRCLSFSNSASEATQCHSTMFRATTEAHALSRKGKFFFTAFDGKTRSLCKNM